MNGNHLSRRTFLHAVTPDLVLAGNWVVPSPSGAVSRFAAGP
ncbi:hypothetical protein [Acetobacter sp.]|nr:hypothetical protein [Acetobacter sp.]